MNKLYKVVLGLTTLMVTSCTKYEALEFSVIKPESATAQEDIDAYPALKSYINRTTYPNFKFGVALSLSDYVNKGVMYRLANKNFDEIVLGYEMKHGAVVQADGSLALDNVSKLLATAKENNILVYGHTLCWHANQNATYLKKVIAPDILSSTGPGWDLITAADFEGNVTNNFEANANAVTSYTATGGGANGVGRALKITNASVRTNDWEAQFFLKFSPVAVLGEKYTLKMDVKADVSASYPTQAHVTAGAYKHWDFFGTISATPTWTTYTKEITITADMATCGAIAFNLGKTATNFYFDNITLTKYNATGSVQTKEKTSEQKNTLITSALDKWMSGMMTVSKPYVKAWDVVNEPMDDGKPYELKTGVGKTLATDEFYWQDYMGKDYAVTAFQLARKYGNASDILFINDYNLEYNLDKCRGLIAYVSYIEGKGVKVDGIGTQMHIDIKSDKTKIADMFKLLAATGKVIKISELDIGLGSVKTDNATQAQYQAQAEMYKYVIDKYFELIPAAQRYGITLWSPLDSPANSSWRADEPIGLWTKDYVRKVAYSYVAESIKANMK
ncbi:endo-1,4-beta-xylanase [Arcicella aquatica]|uniref:Beta-xylanase n=1 Tax=Arcicella aquatica TaxID=217141 RepID=A0ABU5QMU8_9BACT|nr:endo-1,4-beta-xylanase [Arcicella aquatica]MEA5258387.1 endo-1,4-beta-xylanase [Arcicella aquatica]